MKKIKVLHVINGMSSGGAETYIMNILRNIDHNQFQFDFLLRTKENQEFYIKEIKDRGGNVFYTAPFPKKIFSNYFETKRFFKQYEYDVVEVHANSLIYILPMLILRKYSNTKVIMHSHSTRSSNKILTYLHYFHRLFIHKICDVCIACSEEAGKWMFKRDFKIIKNAIDIDKFINPKNPISYSEKNIFCMVARFLPVKNHIFAIKLFNEYIKKDSDSRLILVGIGPLMSEVEEEVNKLGLKDKVSFLNERRDVENIIFNCTCFILPSIYEGIPLTLIEAQAANVPCIVSDTVDRRVNITGQVQFAKLNDLDDWIDKIRNIKTNSLRVSKERLIESGYDIKENIKKIMKLYRN